MKIIIVGAGIGGLSAYLYLNKHLKAWDDEMVIYDAYDVRKLSINSKPMVDPTNPTEPIFTPAAIGAAIGIAKNGCAVLSRIDHDGHVLDEMKRRGHSIKYWRMMTARGWDLTSPAVAQDKEKEYETLMIARQTAWEVLRDEVLRINPHVIVTKKVNTIHIPETDTDRPCVTFSDGGEDEADLLIGADGLRSCVRKAMLKGTLDKEPRGWFDVLLRKPATIKDYTTPHYEGLSGVGGFVPSSVLKEKGQEAGTMNIIFGPNGFFGCGYISTSASRPSSSSTDSQEGNTSKHDLRPGDTATWWATFSSSADNPYPIDKSKTKDNSNKQTFDAVTAREDLIRRLSHWQQPVIHGILAYIQTHGISHFYPTYTTPELPTWHKGNVVLLGDAAHALQPSSGQGASQALEDAESLALLLRYYMDKEAATTSEEASRKAAIQTALRKYVELRKPRVHAIYVQSQKISGMKSDMGFISEMLMYFFIWIMSWFNVLQRHNKQVLDYDLVADVQRIINAE